MKLIKIKNDEYVKFYKLEKKINGSNYDLTISNYKRFSSKKWEGWKINWSALGDVDIETAKAYNKIIEKAIDFVEEKIKEDN